MRVPRVQFRVRHLMIVLAVAATAAFAERTYGHWLTYREKAAEYRRNEKAWRERAQTDDDPAILVNIAYYAWMRESYADLASHPWKPEPDLPHTILPIPGSDVPPEYASDHSAAATDR